LENVICRDYFPREALRYSLSVGDVHLLTLRTEMAGVAVPGKLYGIMAAGRPVIVVGPTQSEPAATVTEEAVGVVIDPDAGGDGAAVARAILAYRDDATLRGEAGRRARAAFMARYERAPACAAWEDLLLRVVGEGRPAVPGAPSPPA
jgi:glycosyltransferase involved in cell wall biosynthesis